MREKLSRYLTQYLDSRLIFVADTFLSVLASIFILLSVNFLADSDFYTGSFAIWWICGALVFSLLTVYLSRNYRVIIRHSTIRDMRNYFFWVLVKELLLCALMSLSHSFSGTLLSMLIADYILTIFLVLCFRMALLLAYDVYKDKVKVFTDRSRLLIYGTTEKAVAMAQEMLHSNRYSVAGFLSDDHEDDQHTIAGYTVYNSSDFRAVAKSVIPGAVLFTNNADAIREEKNVVAYCARHGIKTMITPVLDEVIDGQVMKNKMRDIKIEDVLGREEIQISLDAIKANFKDKVIMVTGAAGSIGSELCRQLATFGVKKLVLYDNAETPMHNLRLELEARFPELDFVPVIGSVRHDARLDFVFSKYWPQVVFHAAAYKHVPLMEENPCEAVLANVLGSRAVADRCVEYGTEMMVMISTDKAVNPTNVMGCSKRLAEIYVQSLGLALEKGDVKGRTKFVTTRFGNVLGSNGSVIPRFRDQIAAGGPVTVTHPEINRFFMTIPEACRLVMEAATMSTGNQIFVFDMGKPVKIVDLARRMIELAGYVPDEEIKIVYTGLRPGEKLYEEVLSNAENTDPTSHDRIRVAKVRKYSYEEACRMLDNLSVLARQVFIPEMVRMMKEIVPEFKSRNSKYEAIDRELEEEQRKKAL